MFASSVSNLRNAGPECRCRGRGELIRCSHSVGHPNSAGSTREDTFNVTIVPHVRCDYNAYVTTPGGGVTGYTYDETGNRLTQTDALGRVTSYEYDKLGWRVKRTLPLGMSESYAYDPAGNLTRRTDFRGKTATYAYDVMDRLLSKTPDPSLGEPQVTYAYTATGRRASMTAASGTTTYTYDAQDRLLKKQTPWGSLAYTYDAPGNVRSVRSSNAEGDGVRSAPST